MLKAVTRRRLTKLANFLKIVPVRKFDMCNWVEGESASAIKNLTDKVTCGTTGCAVGWACTVPSFKKQGLKMGNIVGCEGHYAADVYYKNYSNFQAASEFFHIEEDEAQHLFSPSNYPKNRHHQPKYVAKRIEAFIRKKDRGTV